MDEDEKNFNESKNCTIKDVKDGESDENQYESQQINGHSVALSEQQDDIANVDEINQENENNHSVDVLSSNGVAKCSNSRNDENLMKEKIVKKGENSEIITKELSSMNSSKLSETMPSKTSLSSTSSKNMPESSLSSSDGNNSVSTVQDECRTSFLIKKQMNEIDKEINRRIQNRNIKKKMDISSNTELKLSIENTCSVFI
ncbi:unnamed protein product [Acanthocheilonema viteae]|uniref:Uncharacterized protein n=1 Tax=Acanthocheilonema viteae TaxID=6277 RepID=A0A498SRN7_ACAVI|nr:unnamed protein product [Acanthocheilonema viteae]